MNRREDYIIDRIDRARAYRSSREAYADRLTDLDWRAKRIIGRALDGAKPADRADFIRSLAKAVRLHLTHHHGSAAASILSREAYQAGRAGG